MEGLETSSQQEWQGGKICHCDADPLARQAIVPCTMYVVLCPRTASDAGNLANFSMHTVEGD